MYPSISNTIHLMNMYLSVMTMNKIGEEYFIQQIGKTIELINKIISILIRLILTYESVY